MGLLIMAVQGCYPSKERIIKAKDGLIYKYIDAGEFLMGCIAGDTLCDAIEKPQQAVTITKGFYISTTEVTVAAFRKFVNDSGYAPESITQHKGRVYSNDSNWQWVEHINWEHPFKVNNKAPDNTPVTQVSYNDAVAYCQWMGGRLPAEEQWEYAARGGLENNSYPWGNLWPPTKDNIPLSNTADSKTLSVYPTMEGLKNYDDGFISTAPVGSFQPNGFGLYDMAGNVWEWTSTRFYKGYGDVEIDSIFIKYDARITRGGAWCYYPAQMRCSDRGYFGRDDFWTGSLGFRCVINLLQQE